MQLHEILPWFNLLLILFLFYELRKHHYIGKQKDDKNKDDKS